MGDTYSTRGQDLRGQEPPSSFLAEIDYRDCNLRNTELANITLHLADLRNADFREAFLEDADLRYADLRRADLRGAQLYGARLFGADLRGARLKGADLVNVDLRNTRLEETDLAWCDLEFGADLEGASFDGTRLAIVNLNQAGAFDRLCAIARSCNARRDYSREPADAGFRWMSGDTAVSRSEYEAERCEDEDAERCEDENGFAIVRGGHLRGMGSRGSSQQIGRSGNAGCTSARLFSPAPLCPCRALQCITRDALGTDQNGPRRLRDRHEWPKSERHSPLRS